MTATIGLTTTQLTHARRIVAACRAFDLPADQGLRVADIALATALAESGLRMYANAHNQRSLELPHDDVGHDHASVGLFQQQVAGMPGSTAGWGTTEELMDATISTRKFVTALLRHDWIPMTNWIAAQTVQVSAFPDGSNYRAHDEHAIRIRTALWSAPAPRPGPGPAPKPHVVPVPQPAGHGVHVVVAGDTLFGIAQAWGVPLPAIKAANPTAGHPAGNFAVIRPGDRIVHP